MQRSQTVSGVPRAIIDRAVKVGPLMDHMSTVDVAAPSCLQADAQRDTDTEQQEGPRLKDRLHCWLLAPGNCDRRRRITKLCAATALLEYIFHGTCGNRAT